MTKAGKGISEITVVCGTVGNARERERERETERESLSQLEST